MEISKSTIGTFYLSRVLGLAPYTITRDKKGRLVIRRSILLTIYSSALVLILVSLTYRGLLFDANSEIPIRPSFRMRSATSKVVTTIDVSVVVVASLAGVICGIIGLQQTQELNRRLKEADETLSLYTDEVKDRRRGYIIMVAVMAMISIMLGLDIWSWHRVAAKMAFGNAKPELNVQWYIPFYALYYILMGLHIHFAQSAVGLGRRYRRLNLALKNSFQEGITSNGVGIIQVSSLNTFMKAIDTLPTNNQKKVSPGEKIINGARKDGDFPNYEITKLHILDRLAYTHESLGKATRNVSGAFGFLLLFLMTSCLLHLVATSYFLFLEMLIKKDSSVSWLNALWLLFHILRLLLIVEPCHITSAEAKHTITLLCEIQRNSKDVHIEKRMEKFWQQLLTDKANISACGMCTIDRQILTSFSGAIATYLVMLIQFQKTDG